MKIEDQILAMGKTRGIEDKAQEIADWWVKRSTEDAGHVMAKAIQYGAADLIIMGKAMEALIPGADGLDEASLQAAGLEMAIAFYALGKVARLFGAYQQGHVPSGDTWYDLGVYANMARFVREHGRWM